MNTKDIEEKWEEVVWRVTSQVQTGRMSLADAKVELGDLRATLTQHHEAEVERAYERGVADGTDKPLLAIENVRGEVRERIRVHLEREVVDPILDSSKTFGKAAIVNTIRNTFKTPTKTDKQ